MMQSIFTVLALNAVCSGILPDIVQSGINHIVEGPSELDRIFVQQLQEDLQQQQPEDAFPQANNSVGPHYNDLPLSHPSGNDKEPNEETVHSTAEQEINNNTTTAVPTSDLDNNIEHGCITDDDCGKGRYCFSGTQKSRCQPCKDTDVPCLKDDECCGDQTCVWGQCSQNVTKGEPGSTCQYQSDCRPDLCCAIHKALRSPVCSAKPIERERCFGVSNSLMELLSWDKWNQKPRKHCPCAGDLQCQHLGRGSMCLKAEDSSEEELTDSLYSDIDYIL